MLDTIVIRRELKSNEFRTPLIPKDVEILISHNFTVFIEYFKNRCYNIAEYVKCGAIPIESENIYNLDKESTLIVGLKELDFNDDRMFSFKHLYFAHCYKNQTGSVEILNKFKLNGGKLYDLEYLVDFDMKRLVSFGNHAGFMGSLLGIEQFIAKSCGYSICNLVPILDIGNKIVNIKKQLNKISKIPKIAVLGPNGRCGSGAIKLFRLLELECDLLGRNSSKNNLHEYDIVINCIFLDKTEYIEPFITTNILEKFHKCIIVDVSCDCSSNNNPINIYNKSTSHQNPVISFGENIDLIAIDNLPTLVPIESSNYFSSNLVKLLIQINSDKEKVWERNISFYNQKVQ